MAEPWTRRNQRHPLCTCPELTFANLATLDRSQCAGRTIAHPLLDTDQIRQLIASLPTGSAR